MTEAHMSTEQSIQTDVENLRSRFTNTQELYRETCALLFFRYGVTPTANKLYQFVRKGSMSAPAEALTKFWEELRTKSRVQIDAPEMPEQIKTVAAELVGTLWLQAQAAALENLAVLKTESERNVLEAREELSKAANALNATKNELQAVQQKLSEATSHILQLERDLSFERATKESLQVQLEDAKARESAQALAAQSARQEFVAELENVRNHLTLAEERCKATEHRSMIDLDRERVMAQRLGKELSALRQQYTESAEQHQLALASTVAELGALRQSVGTSEGKLQECHRVIQGLMEQGELASRIAADRETKLALLQRDLEDAQSSVVKLEAHVKRQRQELVTMHDLQNSSDNGSRKKRRPASS